MVLIIETIVEVLKACVSPVALFILALMILIVYIFKAGKPLPGGYEEGIRKMKTTKENTLFIGDQIFTDVLGANRAGLYTIMVKPIHPKEEIQIVLKRYLERIVLFFYFRSIRKKSVEK